jgi:cell division protein FtsN
MGGVGLAAVGAAIVWLVGDLEPRPISEADVPLIVADTTPTKRQPEEPGGVAFPNTDKSVYDIIDPDAESQVVERLLPPPEEPVAIAPLPEPEPEPEQAPEALADIAPAAGAEHEPAEDIAAAQVEAGGAVAPLPTPPPSQAGTMADVATAVAALEPEPTPPAAAGGSWRVQVGAFKSRDQAEDEWRRISAKAGDVLAGLEPTIESVDLGADKGIYHRLQLASLADRAASEALCAKLSAVGIGCLVVKP